MNISSIYSQYIDNSQYKENKANIIEIYKVLQQHRTEILNHYK